MSVVTGALGSLATKLLQLLHDEYKLQKGVRKQVQWLHSELESIQAFLCKVSDVPWDRLDPQVKLWAREVREASYDMEDVLDTFLVRVDRGEPADLGRLRRAMKNMGNVFSKAKCRHDIAGAIGDIKKHLEEVAERRHKYKLDEMIMSKPIIPAGSSIDPRLTAMYKEVTHLIGVDKSRDELISMLNLSQPDDDASDKKIIKKVVSIVGVGGLGKTTLAKAVYDKLKLEYDCGAFVSVGRDHGLEKVFKDILFDLDKDKYENIHNTGRGADLLIREVREFLENKRYFTVIDDCPVRLFVSAGLSAPAYSIFLSQQTSTSRQTSTSHQPANTTDVWEVRTWEAIQLALIENNCGSKVIITTRKSKVAEEAGEVYTLKPLSNDDAIKLFYTRISGVSGKCLHNPADDVSDKIINKCAGIPLAIITMSSLLAGKPEYEWPMVYSSIGFNTKGNRESEDTMTIISFSYYDLPPHLRTCLLYLCTYPEDYEIQKHDLIRKWIAEGFINGDRGTRLFEIGERYLNDLINRSLIQAWEGKWDGRVLGCRVHDMVLDLMRKLSSQQNFIATLGENIEGTHAPSNVRRLFHQNRIAGHINSEAMVTRLPNVRLYTAFTCFIDNQDLFLRFKLLRVLDIQRCKFKEGCHLEHIGDLLHLRFLRIGCKGRTVLELPKQIGNLKLLQTLDVRGTLPASVLHLTNLVQLIAYNDVPDGIGKLVFLEELVIFNGSSDKPKTFFKELGSLRELRRLLFSIDEMDESMQRDFVESLSNLQKLQDIQVDGSGWGVDTAMWEAAGFVLPRPLHYLGWRNIKLSKWPSCMTPSGLPNMTHLKMRVTTIYEQDLKLLARLPVLCYLSLVTESTVTASNINAGDGCFFEKLGYFEINAMVKFEQPNQDSISFHIWNGQGTAPFGTGKSNKESNKVATFGVMPNLEVLDISIHLRGLKDNNGDCGNIGLEYLLSLRELRVIINCDGISAKEVRAALAALRKACKVHPNHPKLYMKKVFEEKMVSTQDKEDEEQQGDAELASQTVNNDLGKLSPAST